MLEIAAEQSAALVAVAAHTMGVVPEHCTPGKQLVTVVTTVS